MNNLNIPEWVLLSCTSVTGLIALIAYVVLRFINVHHPKDRLKKRHPIPKGHYDL